MDVTEQWKARTELEKAFEKIKQRTESCPPERERASRRGQYGSAHVWSTSPEGQVDFVNDRWLQFTGLALDEASVGVGSRFFILMSGRGLSPIGTQPLRRGKPWRLKRGFGVQTENIAGGLFACTLRDETGKLVRWYGTAIDIEDLKGAEQALRKSEERWRSVFENSLSALR